LNQFEFFVDLPRFDNAQCADIEDKDLFFPDNRTQEQKDCTNLKLFAQVVFTKRSVWSTR
jgi:hypothetical protein